MLKVVKIESGLHSKAKAQAALEDATLRSWIEALIEKALRKGKP